MLKVESDTETLVTRECHASVSVLSLDN